MGQQGSQPAKGNYPCESKESHKTAGCALAKIPSLSRYQWELAGLDLFHPADTSVLGVTEQFNISQARVCKKTNFTCNFHLHSGSYSSVTAVVEKGWSPTLLTENMWEPQISVLMKHFPCINCIPVTSLELCTIADTA